MRRMLLVLVLVGTVAALVVSGCGSDDSTTAATGAGDTTSAASPGETTDEGGDTTAGADETTEGAEATDSLTRAEFVKQGNEACARIQKKVGEEFEAFIKKQNIENVAPTQAESAEIIGRFAIPAMKEQVEALRALPAPSGDEEKVELIIARQEESLKKMEKEPLFRTSGAPYEELNKPASDYGLTECSV